MSRYQLIDTKTGEIVFPRQQTDRLRTARLEHKRRLRAYEDAKRGSKPAATSTGHKTVGEVIRTEGVTIGLVAFVVVLLIWCGTS